MIKVLRENIDEIKRLRYGGMKIRELAERYNVTYSSMAHFLTTNRIVLNGAEISEDVIQQIINSYTNGISYEVIAKNNHLDKETVRNILINNGVAIRDKSHAFQKYSINETYFDSIDTPNKAYILGLIYADGSTSSDPNHYHLRINLQDRDAEILYKIQDEMGIQRPLHHWKSNKDNCKDQYILLIDNKHMVTKLRDEYGINSNKTSSATFPTFIPEPLIRHFIRGCWDGDGTISRNLKYKQAAFIGTDALVCGIKNYLENTIGVHFTIYDAKCEMEGIKIISIRGRIQTKKFLDFIYEGADLYLERKYQYYQYMYYETDKSLSV